MRSLFLAIFAGFFLFLCPIYAFESFHFSGKIKCELSATFIVFDFDNNIYDKNIELFFYKQIRQEKKFNGIKELLNQINLDIAEAKKILNYGN